MEKDEYKATSITVLKDLEAVRKRASMYIGDTSFRGLHHLLIEVLDNSVDEAMGGFCNNIKVTIHKDGSATVIDNGRGIPVDMHPEEKKPALELVMTVLHAGGKFDNRTYKVSGGLHGVGVSVTNALSKFLEVKVRRDGKIHFQRFERGKKITEMKIIGDTEERGTEITFMPDDEIFENINFDYAHIAKRLGELAFLNAGLKIEFKDEREDKSEIFQYEGGIKEFVEFLNKNKNKLFNQVIYFKKENNVILEIAMQYNDSYQDNVYSFVNNINTIEGGTHEEGFRTALTRVVNDYIKKNKLTDIKLSGEDIREGLTTIISLKIPEPQFEGQTKTKLGNSNVKGIVSSIVYENLGNFFEENPSIAKSIINKCVSAAKARDAARKARDLVRRKSVLESGSLPGKLADCQEKDPEKCEIFIVEGDSAGGCFSGDTKVALADGRNLSFKELVKEFKKGKKNYCYTILKDGSIGIEEIKNPRITKKDVEVVKVILDNDEGIICTPDHKFMLKNYNYKEIQNIKISNSLMPLNKKFSKKGECGATIEGYEMIFDPVTNLWVFTHVLSDQFNLRNKIYDEVLGNSKHHIDFNKLNNNPTNIIRMRNEAHMEYHRKCLHKTLHRKDVQDKLRKLKQTKEFREKMSKRMMEPQTRKMVSENSKRQWENNEYKEYMKKKFLEFYHSNESYRKENNKRLNEEQKKFWNKKGNREKQSIKTKKYFEKNPIKKLKLSEKAKEQWNNSELLKWRSKKTKEQWTPEFRKKRKEAYNKTYFNYTIKQMRELYEKNKLDDYDKIRTKGKNNNLLRYDTFKERFFNNSEKLMIDAIKNYNHKIKKIIKLKEKINVYDIEVPNTHNFALASGVFVHNSSISARDRKFQAILPLRGKVLNVEKARLDKIFKNNEITNLISALGCGIAEEFNIGKLRYHKIIITADSDVDGAHISCLLLTFFFRYMKELIDNGHVYVAQPPLYGVKKGSKIIYLKNEDELEKYVKENKDVKFQRFKGLGEMNPDQLWDTTMDPEKRILKKISIEDVVIADQIFTILMGDDVEPRREFISTYAKKAKNIDV
ncbi:MAG: DNA topoisomerase (ATP-hydrolyzing) subunit B [Nanoarchaeota archaeon]|nr:DNA topoisomerase (ATP-hydrolyzing) subunit B [Nanoarchaeota archaeon]